MERVHGHQVAEEEVVRRARGNRCHQVLDHIVRSIVDNPDSVRVEAVDDDGVIILEVRVADGDLGRVIGRRGRTAQNIRALVRAAAEKDGVDVDVDFLDD